MHSDFARALDDAMRQKSLIEAICCMVDWCVGNDCCGKARIHTIKRVAEEWRRKKSDGSQCWIDEGVIHTRVPEPDEKVTIMRRKAGYLIGSTDFNPPPKSEKKGKNGNKS